MSRGETAPRLIGVSDLRLDEFRALYLAEFGRLRRHVSRLVGNDALGAELTQEAFTRLFAAWRRVREPRSYVFLVAVNLARSHFRRQVWEQAALRRLGVDDAVHESDRVVADAVDRLPRRLREVVVLHYLADLEVADVAAALGRPSGTVKRQLHEARQLLRTSLEESR